MSIADACSYLDTHGIVYDLYEHEPVFTVEQSAVLKQFIPGTHTKNLWLVDKSGGYHLICLQADKRFRLKDFGRKYGFKDLSFGSAESLQEYLGLTPGSVSIMGIRHGASLRLWLDEDLWTADAVGRHPDENSATIVLSAEMIRKFLQFVGHEPEILGGELFG